jgi:cell division protein ZapA
LNFDVGVFIVHTKFKRFEGFVSNATDIMLLGQSFKINCPEGEETTLALVATKLDNIMHNIKQRTQTTNREQITVMAALELGYELHKERLKNEQQAQQLDDRICLLQETLEKALTSHLQQHQVNK